MRAASTFICLFILLQCSQSLWAACVCSEKGSDFCQSCQGPSIVRPKPRYYEPSDVNLSPIGDNCWCSKLLIEPAQLPKTCGKNKPCKLNPSPSPCGCQASDSSSSSSLYDNIAYASERKKDNTPPADPVSVSLAVKAGKAITVPEAKLSYGFAQKPVDGLKKVYFSNVPEENLFKLKSEVITMKKRTSYAAKEEEEEYIEEEEEEKSDDDDGEAPPQLTYKQLGYETELYKNPKFKKISSSKSSSYSSSRYGKVGGKVSVDCGFKPGRVTSYRSSRREELDAGDCY